MRTVKVKIAVAVDTGGDWICSGWSPQIDECSTEDHMQNVRECFTGITSQFWLEAELPIPEEQVINANVVAENENR